MNEAEESESPSASDVGNRPLVAPPYAFTVSDRHGPTCHMERMSFEAFSEGKQCSELITWLPCHFFSGEDFNLYPHGQALCDEALSLLASDNGMSRNGMPAQVDSTLAKQAMRVGRERLEVLVSGEESDQARIASEANAIDLHDWLAACFDGKLSRVYFD